MRRLASMAKTLAHAKTKSNTVTKTKTKRQMATCLPRVWDDWPPPGADRTLPASSKNATRPDQDHRCQRQCCHHRHWYHHLHFHLPHHQRHHNQSAAGPISRQQWSGTWMCQPGIVSTKLRLARTWICSLLVNHGHYLQSSKIGLACAWMCFNLVYHVLSTMPLDWHECVSTLSTMYST